MEQMNLADPRINAALVELQEIIQARYPAATFVTFRGEDPDGMYLRVTVDIDDTDEVIDLVIDRLVELGDDEIPVYVIPVQPWERVAQQLRDRPRRRPTPSLAPLLHD